MTSATTSGSANPSASRNCRAPGRAAPDRGELCRHRTRKISGWPAPRVEWRHLNAIFEPDDRFRPGRTRLIARVTRLPPQRLILIEEPVKAPDPLIGPGRKEFAGEPGNDGLRRHFADVGLLPQVPPEQRRPDFRDRVMNEVDRI